MNTNNIQLNIINDKHYNRNHTYFILYSKINNGTPLVNFPLLDLSIKAIKIVDIFSDILAEND